MKKMYIEYLRILCCYAVILIHVIYQSYLDFSNSTQKFIIIFNFLCFAVPCFVMITGSLQLQKEKKFDLKKSLRKIIIPLLSFGYCFCLMELFFVNKTFNVQMLLDGIINLLTGKSWEHLWYLYMLIGLYLIIPFIKVIMEKINKRDLLIILIVMLFFNSILIDIEKVFYVDIAFYLPIGEIFVFYLLLGYYITNYIKQINNYYLLISWVFLIIVMILLGLNNIRLDSLKYNDIPTVWLSINVFLTMMKFSPKNNKIINQISSLTFGIYIVHMIFVNFIYKYLGFNPYMYNEYLVWCILSILIFIASAILTLCIKKIKVVNKVFRV